MRRTIAILAAMCLAAMLATAAPAQKEAVDEKGNPAGLPKLIKKVNPVYPEEAKKAKVMGAVRLEIVIDQEGKVAEATASKSPDESLAKAAIDAVRQWEYEPVKVNGKPVKVKATVTVNFRLQ